VTYFLAILPSLLVAAALTLAERILRPSQTDWWINLQSWVAYNAASLVVLPLFAFLEGPSLIEGESLPLWLGALLFLIVRDLAEFIYHRAQHSIPLLWSMHSLHHSDPEMSALTTQRHYWADQLIKAMTIWPLTALVIAPTVPIFAIYSIISLWHFFVHTRLPLNFGRWSWVLNSPAYHRRHHSRLPEHFNSNFASLFPVFDVLCGTYNRPDGFPPTGLDQRPKSLTDILFWPVLQDAPDQVAAVVTPGRSAPMPENPIL
jgi:sterol desaturase/sphingolipid hydroxylase (fatty acid hydroxylase superfamily)